MPEPYTPPGSNVAYTVPSLDDPADAPVAFRDFADSIPPIGGPALVINKQSTDYTLVKTDMAGVVEFDTTAGDLKVTIPTDTNLDVPIGSVVVVANVGNTRKKRVTITPAQGVTIRDSADRDIQQYSLVSLLKIDANFWLINAGTAGGTGPTVPLPPTISLCVGSPNGVYLAWTKPADDGGSSIASYVVEQSLDQKEWTQAAIVAATLLDTTVDGLTPGTTYYFRVKASNAVGFSEPSGTASAVPTNSYNDASGGTVSTYEKNGKFFRVHKFTAGGTLKITKAVNPFQILVVGGGGRGGSGIGNGGGGGGGGAGGVIYTTGTIPAADYEVTVGSGSGNTAPGGNSSIGQLYIGIGGGSAVDNAGGGSGGSGAGGGGRGASGGKGTPGQGSDGGNASNDGYWGSGNGGGAGGFDGIETTILGSSMWVGGGGAGGPTLCNNCGGFGGRGGGGSAWGANSGFQPGTDRDGLAPSHNGRPNTGGGGGGGGGMNGPTSGGGAGGSGIVVVAYEVAPFNAATGGSVSDVDDYNGTGQKWRVHTFTGNDKITVQSNERPFKVLLVGGGGGGGTSGGNRGGDCGKGGQVVQQDMALPIGQSIVSIGGGGTGYGDIQDRSGDSGGTTSLAGVSAGGGGGGGWGAHDNYPGKPSSPCTGGTPTTIVGSSWTVGMNGGIPGDQQPGPGPCGNYGGGGGGGCAGYGTGGNAKSGQPGVVVVAYQIG